MAPVFTPLGGRPELRGFLDKSFSRLEGPATEVVRDPKLDELRGHLDRVEQGGDAAELKAAVGAWEALAGPPVRTLSERSALSPEAVRRIALGTLPALGGADGMDCAARLERLTGESRFGDALEAAMYTAAYRAPDVKSARGLARSHGLLQFRGGDADGMAVNLFETGTATLKLDGQDVTVHVLSRFPREGKVQVQFRMAAPARFALWVRVPTWAPELSIRSVATNTEEIGLAGDWARLQPRSWQSSDWVELEFPLTGARPVNPDTSATLPWGPLQVPNDPLKDKVLAEHLDPGTRVVNVLAGYPFPPPPARPSRPAHAEGPFPPGKVATPQQERRGWYSWLKWNPETWEAVVGSEPPGQTWNLRVLPWASTIRHMAFGARPDDLLPGERVNIFMGAGEDGEWSYLTYFQDELMQMRGHHHWWMIRSVTTRKEVPRFTARLYTAGDNVLHLPEVTFELDPACENWRNGKTVGSYPLKVGELVRMISVYRADRRVCMLLTDDASLDAIRDRKMAAEKARVAKEGVAGYVDDVSGDTAHLTVFSTYWQYGRELKPGQAVGVTATGAGQRPTGEVIPATVVSAKVGGQYGSGDTAVEIRGKVEGLRAWMGGKVVRLIPR